MKYQSDETIKTKQGKEDVYPHILKDIDDRIKLGEKKYGTVLQTFNGRNSLQDAYEEAIDLVMYLKQKILESRCEQVDFRTLRDEFFIHHNAEARKGNVSSLDRFEILAIDIFVDWLVMNQKVNNAIKKACGL